MYLIEIELRVFTLAFTRVMQCYGEKCGCVTLFKDNAQILGTASFAGAIALFLVDRLFTV